jgi:N-acetylated-alpha-linked acidic dipeptidase
VIGTIKGTSDELIVMGNHHDSWTCGAVDPVSGSAAMNELVRGLGRLVEMGWKNERKMQAFCKGLQTPAEQNLAS